MTWTTLLDAWGRVGASDASPDLDLRLEGRVAEFAPGSEPRDGSAAVAQGGRMLTDNAVQIGHSARRRTRDQRNSPARSFTWW